jgi:hypothetical protein
MAPWELLGWLLVGVLALALLLSLGNVAGASAADAYSAYARRIRRAYGVREDGER